MGPKNQLQNRGDCLTKAAFKTGWLNRNFYKHGNNENKTDTPSTENVPVQKIKVEKSSQHKWVPDTVSTKTDWETV